jgi:DNA processing protein
MKDELLMHQIAISLIPGIGPVLAKILISYCGGVEEVFRAKRSKLERIPGIGPVVTNAILNQAVFVRAEQEVLYVRKHGIKTLFYYDSDYPERLKRCNDSPVMLFYKGVADLNAARVVSIVGTRNASFYGLSITEKLVEELVRMNVLIVSGMAYGIDICAHKAALNHGVPTVGVFGHGLDRVYPSVHKTIAEKMHENGGLLSEYISETIPEKVNFPMRNRIVAGLSDATIIVEASKKGGALITAELANSYNRDVFAFPGRITDTYSQGCNGLIKKNKAVLIEGAKDLEYIMGWEPEMTKPALFQQKLFLEYSIEESQILNLFKSESILSIDTIVIRSALGVGKIAGILLTLEFHGVLKALPGKMYQIV